MATVQDRAGRAHEFDRIRFKMDETVLQQAAEEVVDQTSERAQLLFDRYCALHLAKYGRNYEPTHFANGKLNPRFHVLYARKAPTIRISIEVRSGPLFDRFVGQPPEYIESSFRSNPRAWLATGAVVVTNS